MLNRKHVERERKKWSFPFLLKIGKLHQRETSGKMPLKLSFNFSLFYYYFFIFYITMLYVAQYIETKVMFNLQSFIYSMY